MYSKLNSIHDALKSALSFASFVDHCDVMQHATENQKRIHAKYAVRLEEAHSVLRDVENIEAQEAYQIMAALLCAVKNCQERNNTLWEDRHNTLLSWMVQHAMPSGGGFDGGTMLDRARSNEDRLVFVTSFHHMNEDGFYDGWTEHEIFVTPSLLHGFDLRITGKNKREIKDYIAESFGLVSVNRYRFMRARMDAYEVPQEQKQEQEQEQ